IAHNWCDESALEGNGHANIGIPELQNAVTRPDRIGGRNALQRCSPGFDDEIVEREFERWLAIFVFRPASIPFLTHRYQTAGVEIGSQIEVWNGLFGLNQSRDDGAAH